jgi:hypothetical protein
MRLQARLRPITLFFIAIVIQLFYVIFLNLSLLIPPFSSVETVLLIQLGEKSLRESCSMFTCSIA